MIKALHLDKTYHGIRVLDDFSFTFEDGHVYILIGEDGSGKTTLLKLLSGCMAAGTGTVFSDGADLSLEPVKARSSIGYLPELPALSDMLTVSEHLRLVSEIRKTDPEAVKETAERFGLTKVLAQSIRTLSKEERLRAGLACALIGSPNNLILDEPFAGLKPGQVRTLLPVFKELSRELTLIIASGAPSDYEDLYDEVLVLSSGRLVMHTDRAELSEKQQSLSELLSACAGAAVSGTDENPDPDDKEDDSDESPSQA